MAKKTNVEKTSGTTSPEKAWLQAVAATEKDLGSLESQSSTEYLSTGSLSLNLALGGGWAQGRCGCVVGPEQSGKTTIELSTIIEALHQSFFVFIGDHEGSMDMRMLQRIADNMYPGELNVEALRKAGRLVYRQPDTGDWTFRAIRKILRRLPQGVKVLFVIDSYAAMMPEDEAEAEKANKGAGMGTHARMFSEHLKTIKTGVSRFGAWYLASNQIRHKIGVMYGSPETEPGGNAVLHYTDQRVKLQRYSPDDREAFGAEKVTGLNGVSGIRSEESVRHGKTDMHSAHAGTVVKNKMFVPFRKFTARIVVSRSGKSGCGLDPVADTFYFLRETGQIEVEKGRYTVTMFDHPFNTETGWGNLTWKQFKAKVLASRTRSYGQVEVLGVLGGDDDIISACRQQISDRSAFDLYAKYSSDGGEAGTAAGTIEGLVMGWRLVDDGWVKSIVAVTIDHEGESRDVALPDMSQDDCQSWMKHKDSIVGRYAEIEYGAHGPDVKSYDTLHIGKTPPKGEATETKPALASSERKSAKTVAKSAPKSVESGDGRTRGASIFRKNRR